MLRHPGIVASAGAVSSGPDLILAGIAGAVSEWDGERSTITGNPVTQWDDLIGTNHCTAALGSGVTPTTVGGLTALDFSNDLLDCGAIVLPEPPAGGATLSMVFQTSVDEARQIYGIGANGDAVAGVAVQINTSGRLQGAVGNGTTRTLATVTSAYTVSVLLVAQIAYNGSIVKAKVNDGTPVSAGHSYTTLNGNNTLGLGARGLGSSTGLTGQIMWAGYCVGALSDANLSTVAQRAMARFSIT